MALRRGSVSFVPYPTTPGRTTMKVSVATPDPFDLIETLGGLVRELLDEGRPDNVYQRILDTAVALIPGAQAGSLTLKDAEGRFRFVAAAGYDLAKLERVSFSHAEALFLAPSGEERSYLIHDLGALDKRMLDEERYRLLQAAGKLSEIKATLMAPIRIAGEIHATLLLDNFDDRRAFTPDARRLAELLASLVGVALKRLQLETRTKALLAEFSRLFEQSFVATVILDPRAGTVAACNESFLALVALKRDELVGRPFAVLEQVVDRTWLEASLRKLEAGRSAERGEVALQTATGRRLWCLASAERFEVESCHYILSFVNITERKLTEEDLLKAVHDVIHDASWLSQAVMKRFSERRTLRHAQAQDASPKALTARESEVLALIAGGRSNRQIAMTLGLAETTVRNYVSQVYHKIGVRSRAEAVIWARTRGMTRS